jgi:hypothetical protein
MRPDDPSGASRAGKPYLLLCGVLSLIAVGLVVYSQTVAFSWDEGFHLLAAQLVNAGKKPYADFFLAQPPLNVYWNALCMRLFGETWQVPHAASTILSAGAMYLTADYVWTRFPEPGWRFAASITAGLSVGLNVAVVQFGTVGQAYGTALFLLVAAFRMAVLAVCRGGWLTPFGAGLFSGGAAACSLLAAPPAPVLLLWILAYNRTGSRWKKCAAFLAGVFLAFLPLLRLFAGAPRQTFFDVVKYHLFYRSLNWNSVVSHNIGVLTAWIDSAQALLLILLAIQGLLFVIKARQWDPERRAEFGLCAWLAATLAIHLSTARPTFEQYFLLVVPFLSILAAVGLYAAGSRLANSGRPLWPAVTYAVLISLGLAKTLYDGRDDFQWSDFEPVARKVEQVTPPGSPILAEEHVYFLSRRQPPSGMEYGDSHKLRLPAAEAASLHVVPRSMLNQWVKSGAFQTVEMCDSDETIEDLGLRRIYAQSADFDNCEVFWGPSRPAVPR